MRKNSQSKNLIFWFDFFIFPCPKKNKLHLQMVSNTKHTAANTKHTIFGPKTMFWCWYYLMSRLKQLAPPLNVNIETPLLIPGDKIIALLLFPAKAVKLVRPLNTFFFLNQFLAMWYPLTLLRTKRSCLKWYYNSLGPSNLAYYLTLTLVEISVVNRPARPDIYSKNCNSLIIGVNHFVCWFFGIFLFFTGISKSFLIEAFYQSVGPF